MPSLSRLVVLLALLPQLLVLGLGRGVVICVAPGGHVQVEIAASACCTGMDTISSEAAPEGQRGGDGEGAVDDDTSDCGSCADLRILVDSRVSRAPEGADADTGTPAGPPFDASALLGHGQRAFVAPRGAQGDLEPPHLLHLRSVLQRC